MRFLGDGSGPFSMPHERKEAKEERWPDVFKKWDHPERLRQTSLGYSSAIPQERISH
jgi:hypothetical protein